MPNVDLTFVPTLPLYQFETRPNLTANRDHIIAMPVPSKWRAALSDVRVIQHAKGHCDQAMNCRAFAPLINKSAVVHVRNLGAKLEEILSVPTPEEREVTSSSRVCA